VLFRSLCLKNGHLNKPVIKRTSNEPLMKEPQVNRNDNFKDWRAHLLHYKRLKGYEKPLPKKSNNLTVKKTSQKHESPLSQTTDDSSNTNKVLPLIRVEIRIKKPSETQEKNNPQKTNKEKAPLIDQSINREASKNVNTVEVKNAQQPVLEEKPTKNVEVKVEKVRKLPELIKPSSYDSAPNFTLTPTSKKRFEDGKKTLLFQLNEDLKDEAKRVKEKLKYEQLNSPNLSKFNYRLPMLKDNPKKKKSKLISYSLPKSDNIADYQKTRAILFSINESKLNNSVLRSLREDQKRILSILN